MTLKRIALLGVPLIAVFVVAGILTHDNNATLVQEDATTHYEEVAYTGTVIGSQAQVTNMSIDDILADFDTDAEADAAYASDEFSDSNYIANEEQTYKASLSTYDTTFYDTQN